MKQHDVFHVGDEIVVFTLEPKRRDHGTRSVLCFLARHLSGELALMIAAYDGHRDIGQVGQFHFLDVERRIFEGRDGHLFHEDESSGCQHDQGQQPHTDSDTSKNIHHQNSKITAAFIRPIG